MRLYLSNYTVPHNCDLQVVSAARLRLSGHATSWRDQPLWGAAGREVHGALAFHIEEGLHVQIRPLRPGLYGPRYIACYITISVPKRCFGCNLHPVNLNQMRGVIDGIIETLREIGIEGDVLSAKICGIDLFRNIVLNEPFENYMPLLRCLHPSRINNVRHFKSGALMMNTQRIVRFYDKGAEMRRRGVRRREAEERLNILRSEFGWRKGKVVKKELDIETVEDLLNSYDRLPTFHRDAMQKTWHFPPPHRNYASRSVSAMTHSQQISDCIRLHGLKGWKYVCEATGRRVLQEALGDERILQEILSQSRASSHSRSDICKFKRQYREDQYMQAVADDPRLLSLRDEVLSKVLRDKSLILIPSPVTLPSPRYVLQERMKSVAA